MKTWKGGGKKNKNESENKKAAASRLLPKHPNCWWDPNSNNFIAPESHDEWLGELNESESEVDEEGNETGKRKKKFSKSEK